MDVKEQPEPNLEGVSRGKSLSQLDNPRLLQQLQSLVSASVAISGELDLDLVLQLIADTVREFVQSHYAAIGIVDRQGVITSFITSGISQTEREKIGEPPRGHGLLGVLIKQGTSLRVRDMSKDSRSSGFPPNHPPMTSLLGMPVSLQGRIVGDLYLTDKIASDEFSAEDEWWLALFARQAAVALENANLYKKLRLAHQRAQTLVNLTGALNRAINPEELFRQITQAACQLLELPASALYLLSSQRNCFNLQAEIGLYLEPGKDASLPLEGSIASQVLAQNVPMVVPDTQVLKQIFFPPLREGQLPRSLVVVPIRYNQQVTGVIEVYDAQPRDFSLEEVGLLEAFAGQASLVLERARVYQQKEEFLSMTAHDIRAPLTAIKISAGLLESSLPADSPPVLNRLVNNIGRNSDRLNNLVNDLLDLSRLEQGKVRLQLERLEIGEAIAATIQPLLALFEEKSQKLVFEQPAHEYWVMLDRHRFEQSFVNLLSNANKYTPNEGKVTVSLQVLQGSVIIRITDTGPGISSEEQLHIFDRYYRRPIHDHTAETSGSGLGLVIARNLIELHGGQLWVESEVAQGSTFLIKLPLTLPK